MPRRGRLSHPPRTKLGVRASVNRLVGLLDDLGFAPQRRESDGEVQVGLRHCPFLELADEARAVICPIHLGLMQGAMATWRAPVTVDRLTITAHACWCGAQKEITTKGE